MYFVPNTEITITNPIFGGHINRLQMRGSIVCESSFEPSYILSHIIPNEISPILQGLERF